MEKTCWCDKLNDDDRATLAPMLARWCQRFYDARLDVVDTRRNAPLVVSRTLASAEMSELHMDVTDARR